MVLLLFWFYFNRLIGLYFKYIDSKKKGIHTQNKANIKSENDASNVPLQNQTEETEIYCILLWDS